MNTRILRTLAYPLVTTTLTKQECTGLMTPILVPVLGKAKIVRTIPRAILYGPTKYQGFGLTNLHVYQGCAQIAQLLQFWNTSTELGKVYKISYEYLLMELGVQQQPFQVNYAIYHKCAEESLLKHIWKFTHDHNIRLQIHGTNLKPQRENDVCLMSTFAESQHRTGSSKLLGSASSLRG